MLSICSINLFSETYVYEYMCRKKLKDGLQKVNSTYLEAIGEFYFSFLFLILYTYLQKACFCFTNQEPVKLFSF